ncbi:hypothetical protein KPL76_08510 [Subtercola sp. PAMC28395]|uniref:hypothetical protein n=1 Tax=Subtercola sp. PAMC28395 TaxID=2846775 RepID=UPI001C0CF3AE|nr:hypothetical protein [Subtercola sp. PAMC28395]QWT22844.1 hypothetical protein KPL76_08510 [Subtercola sp. PAMC28395]
MEPHALRELLAPLAVPHALASLAHFALTVDGYYAEDFVLCRRNDHRLRQYSTAAEFAARLRVFGQANEDGSEYALRGIPGWAADDLPVVVLGDEGGLHPVAENSVEFLRFLAADRSIGVSRERVWLTQDELHDDSPGHPAYAHWLELHFGCELRTAEGVLARAEDRFGEAVRAFAAKLASS